MSEIGKASDGLPALMVGEWAEEKHFYLSRYLDMVSTGMRKKWKNLTYIDLFSGPGKNIVRINKKKKEIDGSPLITIKLKHPFSKYIFVEKSPQLINALKDRCQKSPIFNKMEFIEGDCNKKIAEIVNRIPEGSLGIAFIDPYGLDFWFSSLEKLVNGRSMDMVINFPIGMAIKRNVDRFIKKRWSCLDEFLGDDKWREEYKKRRLKNDRWISKFFLDYYQGKLLKLNYCFDEEKHRFLQGGVLIKNRKGVPLYYLFFAAKHPAGLYFWKEAIKYDPSGQKRLKL